MTTWRRPPFAAASFLAVCVLLALVSPPAALTEAAKPPPAPPPPTPVQVVNTPLPVTGSVNAAVAGTIQAQQHGAWNVGINGTPTVKVGNTPADPVPVTGNINASVVGPVQARQEGGWSVLTLDDVYDTPYSTASSAPLGNGIISGDMTFDVPVGKRLVIETVTVHFEVPPGQKGRVFLNTSANGVVTVDSLSMHSQGVFEGLEQLVGTHSIKERVDATPSKGEIVFRFQRSPTAGTAFIEASVHGYLVPPFPLFQ